MSTDDLTDYESAQHALHVAREDALAATSTFLQGHFLHGASVSRAMLGLTLGPHAPSLLANHLGDLAADLAPVDAVLAGHLRAAHATVHASARRRGDGADTLRAKAHALEVLRDALHAATPSDATARKVAARRGGGPVEVWEIVRETRGHWVLAPVRLAPGEESPGEVKVPKRNHDGWTFCLWPKGNR